MRVKKRTSHLFVATGVAVALASGCEQLQIPKPDACPPKLQGTPSSQSSGIQWGENAQRVSADIVAVLVECIPARHEAIETDKGRRDAFTDYDVAATATVVYKIADQAFFEKAIRSNSIDFNVIFEAV